MISPLMANVYLHYVFDLWVEAWRKKVASGEVVVVRYADDLVVGFQHVNDAERFLKEFRERLAKFALELHPEKTRLIEFGRLRSPRPATAWRGETRDVHVSWVHALLCGERQEGTFAVWRRYGENADGAKLKAIKAELHRRMHEPVNASEHGSEALFRAITNTMLFPEISSDCASSGVASTGCGGVSWSAAASAPDEVGATYSGLRHGGYHHPASCIPILSSLLRHSSFVRAVCVNAHVRICAGCALKLMESSLLKWRPRQSLARSREPSLA